MNAALAVAALVFSTGIAAMYGGVLIERARPSQGALERRAVQDGVVFVPVSLEVVAQAEEEELGPVYVRLSSDFRGDPLVRQAILRRP